MNKAGEGSAHHAALDGRLESLKLLLAADARSINTFDSVHKTPLMYSIEGGHRDCCAWLIDQGGASVNSQDRVRVFPLEIFFIQDRQDKCAHPYLRTQDLLCAYSLTTCYVQACFLGLSCDGQDIHFLAA